MSIAYNGPAEGLDSAQYADTWLDRNLPGMALPRESTVIGGQPAVIVHDLPGMMFVQRSAFVVAHGVKYQIVLLPQPHDMPQLADEATLAWDTVTGSIVFFPPQNSRTVVRAADVCPAETSGSKLVVDLMGGYCLLYLTDFGPDPGLPGRITGGPELGPFDGFDSVRASLTVGSYELWPAAREQGLWPIGEQIDPGSAMTTIIGGYPAVVFDFTGGPWRQRNAKILVGDVIYILVGQPWDAEKFPQALPDVERLWTMVSESMAFFTKWR